MSLAPFAHRMFRFLTRELHVTSWPSIGCAHGERGADRVGGHRAAQHRRPSGQGRPDPAGTGRRDVRARHRMDARDRRPGGDHQPADRTDRGHRRRRLPRRPARPARLDRCRLGGRGRQLVDHLVPRRRHRRHGRRRLPPRELCRAGPRVRRRPADGVGRRATADGPSRGLAPRARAPAPVARPPTRRPVRDGQRTRGARAGRGVRCPPPGGRTDRATAAAARHRERRRQHGPAPLLAEPRSRTGAPGERSAHADRRLTPHDPWARVPRPRPRDRPRDGEAGRAVRGARAALAGRAVRGARAARAARAGRAVRGARAGRAVRGAHARRAVRGARAGRADRPACPRERRAVDPRRGGVGGHTAQHHPGEQGLQRQRRDPVVELHASPRARGPDHRRGVAGRPLHGGQPAHPVAARQERHRPTVNPGRSRAHPTERSPARQNGTGRQAPCAADRKGTPWTATA